MDYILETRYFFLCILKSDHESRHFVSIYIDSRLTFPDLRGGPSGSSLTHFPPRCFDLPGVARRPSCEELYCVSRTGRQLPRLCSILDALIFSDEHSSLRYPETPLLFECRGDLLHLLADAHSHMQSARTHTPKNLLM